MRWLPGTWRHTQIERPGSSKPAVTDSPFPPISWREPLEAWYGRTQDSSDNVRAPIIGGEKRGTSIDAAADRQTSSRLCLCLVASVAVHAGLLYSVGASSGQFGGANHRANTSGHSPVSQLTVTLVWPASVDSNANAAFTRSADPPRTLPPEVSATTRPSGTDRPEQEQSIVVPPFLDLPAPHYFRGSELTRRPRVIGDVVIGLPTTDSAISSGAVRLRILLSEIGSVDDALVAQSELPAPFEAAAVAAFSRAKFAPGEIDGKPVKSEMQVEVSFDGLTSHDEADRGTRP